MDLMMEELQIVSYLHAFIYGVKMVFYRWSLYLHRCFDFTSSMVRNSSFVR